MLNPYSTIAVIVALVELFYKEPENETYFQDLDFGFGATAHSDTKSMTSSLSNHVIMYAVALYSFLILKPLDPKPSNLTSPKP